MKSIILLFVAYLIGSIPSGIWIGKIFYQKDIREFGSGNTGTTNTFRILGKKAGVAVMLMDVLKGTLATMLPHFFEININPLFFGICAVIGHTFPIFAKFKGGKAVATSAGVILGYSPIFFAYSAAIFFSTLLITSMVSLTSIISAVLITLSSVILPFTIPAILPQFDWLLTTILLFLTIFIIIRHRDNIHRIKNGTENKVSFGLKKINK